jgi:hypothetical protein
VKDVPYKVHFFSGLQELQDFAPLSKLIASLQRNMPNHDVENYFIQKREMLSKADATVIACRGAPNNYDVLGLISMRMMPKREEECPSFAFVWTVHVAESMQKGPLLMRLIAALFLAEAKTGMSLPTWTALKTFHPSSYYALLRLREMIGPSALLHPRIDCTKGPHVQENIVAANTAKCIATQVEPGHAFDGDVSVIRGAGGVIGSGYWQNAPRSRNESINKFFDKYLTPNDRMLCLLGLTNDDAKRSALYLLEKWLMSGRTSRLEHKPQRGEKP